MRTLLLLVLLSLTTMCCSSPNTPIKDDIPNETQITMEVVEQKDTIPDFIIADTVYDEGYVFLTCRSLQIDTSAKLSVCPILILDSEDGNSLFILVSSNRKDMLKINTCNVIMDGKQYPTYMEKKVLEKNHLEVVLFSVTDLNIEAIQEPKEIKFAFWGDYGSVMFKTSEQQAKEFTTLIEYYN